MRLKKSILSLSVILIMINLLAIPVTANVPDVENVTKTNEVPGYFNLTVEITHLSPSPTHYVNAIEYEFPELSQFGGKSNLSSQSTTTFTIDLGQFNAAVIDNSTMRIRVNCTTHGWSAWAEFDIGTPSTDNGNGTDTPDSSSDMLLIILALVVIVVAVIVVLLFLRKGKS